MFLLQIFHVPKLKVTDLILCVYTCARVKQDEVVIGWFCFSGFRRIVGSAFLELFIYMFKYIYIYIHI